jgi:hypothetical protein
MNVVKIIGGIGNQMCQYAFGRTLQEMGKQVSFDTSWYSSKAANDPDYPRSFRLDKFQLRNFYNHLFILGNPIIYERRIGMDFGIFNMKIDCNFEGFWQYYAYYEKILPLLRQELQLKTEVYTDKFLKLAEKIWNKKSVSVHVRRGDYQLHRKGAFRDLPAKYYFNAIRETEGDLFIFSDDMPWCKHIFRAEYFSREITFVDIEDYLAFELMKFCNIHITTNSTFSFWAALMDDKPDKVVYCPKGYLGDDVKFSTQFRYPITWIKLEDYATHRYTEVFSN